MTLQQNVLLKGALKSAVSAATGLIIGMPIVDPEHFNPTSFGGWAHLLAAIAIVVVVGEARYWNQWANSGNGTNPGK